MNAPHTIHAEAAVEAIARGLLASLPLSWTRAADPDEADAVAIAGDTGWAAHAASLIHGGVRRVVVTDPRQDDPAAVRALAHLVASERAVVLLSEPYAGNPGLTDLPARLADHQTVAIEALGPRSAADLLFDQLRLARALGIADLALDYLAIDDRSASAVLRGRQAADPVHLRLLAASTRAGVPQLIVRAYGMASILTATVFDATTSRPTTISGSTADAGSVEPTRYENAHRATWRALLTATTSSDLIGFAEDVELLTS